MSNNVENTQQAMTKEQLREERREERREWWDFQKKEFVKNVNIVKQLVVRSVKVQYRNSVIGILWTVLNPLLNMLVMFLVFSTIFTRGGFTVPSDEQTYALYLLCGNIVFGMMRTATFQALPSIVENRGLLTKNKMSYNVFPLSYTLSAVVNFAFSLVALLGVMVFVHFFYGETVFSLNIFLVFVALPALFLFCYGLSLILSALYTFFRDIKHFYNVFLTLWMYITPIFYSVDMFKEEADKPGFGLADLMNGIIHANPMYYYVEYFRDILYRCSARGAYFEGLVNEGKEVTAAMWELAALPGFSETFVIYAIGIVTTLIGAIVFMATKRKFIYNI